MDLTCQERIDMQTLEDRHKELEKAWSDLLKEKREVDARVHNLEQQEMQFALKWQVLIQETQKLADDKKNFEIRRKFFDEVKANAEDDYSSAGMKSTVRGDGFFSGVTDMKSLKKRYKDLLKIYHPDSECGDNDTVQEINREYEKLKERF